MPGSSGSASASNRRFRSPGKTGRSAWVLVMLDPLTAPYRSSEKMSWPNRMDAIAPGRHPKVERPGGMFAGEGEREASAPRPEGMALPRVNDVRGRQSQMHFPDR